MMSEKNVSVKSDVRGSVDQTYELVDMGFTPSVMFIQSRILCEGTLLVKVYLESGERAIRKIARVLVPVER